MKRYSIFPIQEQDIWNAYQAALDQHWVAGEVDLKNDRYDQLSPQEKKVLKTILAFFVVSDGIVNENIVHSLIQDAPCLEAECFYGFQVLNEQVHAETYGLFVEEYIKDAKEKAEMFSPIESMETVRKKAEWALKWLNSDSKAHRMIAFAVVEGLFFSSLFATVFYFKAGNKVPGLIHGNELIRRDENSHYEFAVMMYKKYFTNDISLSEIKDIILEAYEVEKVFVEEMLEVELPGYTKAMVTQYIQFVTDTILQSFGISAHFKVKQPLAFMDAISLESKSNFFERRSGTYTKVEASESVFDDNF